MTDGAGFFSQTAVDQAMKTMQAIERNYGVQVAVETVREVPIDQMAKNHLDSEKERYSFFSSWADRRAEDEGVKGIYILICKNPPYLVAEPDKLTQKKGFSELRAQSSSQEDAGPLREKTVQRGIDGGG